jgi:hypothetical protein
MYDFLCGWRSVLETVHRGIYAGGGGAPPAAAAGDWRARLGLC